VYGVKTVKITTKYGEILFVSQSVTVEGSHTVTIRSNSQCHKLEGSHTVTIMPLGTVWHFEVILDTFSVDRMLSFSPSE